AQAAGYRACLRCRPDATPGSPEWDARADLVGRAMRLIADGVVDREGVAGLARRLHYSERHVHRQLVAEVGAGPIALARAQRANAARLLIETTDLPVSQVAFAAGFSSIRQFNDTIRAVFARTPSELRAHGRDRGERTPGALTVRLPHRRPLDAAGLLRFLGARAVPGLEEVAADGAYRRALRLPQGTGVVTVRLPPGSQAAHVDVTFRLTDLRDLAAAVERTRRLLDLDADPVAVAEHLGADALLGPLVAAAPGRRVPGTVDGAELAVRAVLGQQVSVAGARTLAGRLVAAAGTPLARPEGTLTHVFPSPAAVADGVGAVGMPATRRAALVALSAALDDDLALDPGADRADVERRLLAVPGIGPWTAGYVALRALGDPDAFLPGDLGVRHALTGLGVAGDPAAAARTAERWRPWRAYALVHLWASLDAASPARSSGPAARPDPPDPSRPADPPDPALRKDR
ncbi:MAG: helix-turn-helix domain-containing protein, partial [Acidimicrobiales bacterium]|nr:helix-turn-helix domain-containing protein [Acidimicrobiales bacterium]